MDIFRELTTQDWLIKVIQWFVDKHIEIIATITGFIYLLYSIKGDKRLWIYGIITSALYVFVCFEAKIYADMGINVYYVIVSVYGLVHWSGSGSPDKENLNISNTKLKEALLLLGFTVIVFFIIGYLLKYLTDSDIPFWDALTTSASITATWMLARKMMEHWLIWIVVDAISVALYIYKGLYPTSILFFVYTVLAITGYIEWRKQWIKQKANQK